MKILPSLLVTAALVTFRLLPHPENFSPFGAFALAAGLWIGWRAAVGIPLLALFASDVVLNLAAGYTAIYLPRTVDYAAFALIAALGCSVRGRGFPVQLGAAAATPFVFFLLSNFGVWLFGRGLGGLPYAKTFGGLFECYVAGLPFLRGTMAGDWLFLGVTFLLVHLIRSTRPTPFPQHV